MKPCLDDPVMGEKFVKVALIVNPVSGGGRGREIHQRLLRRATREGDAADSFVTERSGDARRFAHDLSEPYDAVLVVGGDGTFNEVINGLQESSRYPLLQVPLGTANMLARELDQPKDLNVLYDIVRSGKIRTLDLVSAKGEWGSRRFVLLSSVGFDALVTHEVAKTRTGTMGYAAYICPIVRSLCRYRKERVEAVIDGEERIFGAMVVASKTKNYGGVLTITDRAELGSGEIDVAIFRRGSILSLAVYTIVAYFGRISKHPWVVYRKAKSISIFSANPVCVQADGDFIGQTPLHLECLNDQIRILVS